jgi:hypothetical protein
VATAIAQQGRQRTLSGTYIENASWSQIMHAFKQENEFDRPFVDRPWDLCIGFRVENLTDVPLAETMNRCFQHGTSLRLRGGTDWRVC